jgi:hypothetical protein
MHDERYAVKDFLHCRIILFSGVCGGAGLDPAISLYVRITGSSPVMTRC